MLVLFNLLLHDLPLMISSDEMTLNIIVVETETIIQSRAHPVTPAICLKLPHSTLWVFGNNNESSSRFGRLSEILNTSQASALQDEEEVTKRTTQSSVFTMSCQPVSQSVGQAGRRSTTSPSHCASWALGSRRGATVKMIDVGRLS